MKRLLFLPLLAVMLTACQTETDVDVTTNADTMDTQMEPANPTAMVQLVATEGHTVSGNLTFTQEAGGVRIEGTVTGLTPGEHGFHVHQNGDCGPGPDGTPAGAAGDHFSPGGSPHGAPTAASGQRHEGDLGNITAGDDGMVMVNMTDPVLTLEGANSIVGKALIVHANPDDLTTQPSGNAGARVSCGVIQMGSGMNNGMMSDTTGGMSGTTTPGGTPGGAMDAPANPTGGTGQSM